MHPVKEYDLQYLDLMEEGELHFHFAVSVSLGKKHQTCGLRKWKLIKEGLIEVKF